MAVSHHIISLLVDTVALNYVRDQKIGNNDTSWVHRETLAEDNALCLVQIIPPVHKADLAPYRKSSLWAYKIFRDGSTDPVNNSLTESISFLSEHRTIVNHSKTFERPVAALRADPGRRQTNPTGLFRVAVISVTYP